MKEVQQVFRDLEKLHPQVKLIKMKQTAVEWLWDMLLKGEFINNPEELFEQAKAMEKEQREELYNETEVLQLLIKLKQTESFDNLYEWFEENKKTFKSE